MRIAVVLVALLPAIALGNGGPVAWTAATVFGTLEPEKPEHLELLSEELKIAIQPNGNEYKANAIYRVKKTKRGKQTVKFALPTSWPSHPWNEKPYDEKEQKEFRRKAAQSVSISLNNQKYRCVPVDTIDPWPVWRESLEKAAPRQAFANLNNWCVSRVEFPEKTGTLELQLAYSASLIYADEEMSTSPTVSYGIRKLFYPLFPAAAWAAENFEGNVEIDSGPLDWIENPSRGWRNNTSFDADTRPYTKVIREQNKLVFQFNKSYLKQPGVLEVEFAPENLQFKAKATWNKFGQNRIKMSATSNTSLPEARYAAKFAVDGDPDTAWCFRSDFGQNNPEMTLKFSVTQANRSARFSVAAGYFKNQKLFESNGKVVEAELRTCDGKFRLEGQYDVKQRDFRHAWLSIKDEQTPEFQAHDQKKDGFKSTDWRNLPEQYVLPIMLRSGCLKLTIKKIVPSTEPDTCISEIIPFIY